MTSKNFNKTSVISAINTIEDYVGTWVWLKDNYRGWAKIVGYSYDSYDGFLFEWEQYDIGPDITELYDDGIFNLNDIGTSVFFGDEAEKKAHEADNVDWSKVG